MEYPTVQVYADIYDFLDACTVPFSNECDFQLRLAEWLKDTGHYDRVHTEYYVSLHEIEKYSGSKISDSDFPWKDKKGDADLYIDLVVEKDGVFIPIELKYKTKAVYTKTLPFGIPNPEMVNRKMLKDSKARPYNRYLIWKDVRWMELLQSLPNVHAAAVVFVSDDPAYWQASKQTGFAKNFPTVGVMKGDLEHPKEMLKDPKSDSQNGGLSEDCPPFMMRKTYVLSWQKLNGVKHYGNFRYCVIPVFNGVYNFVSKDYIMLGPGELFHRDATSHLMEPVDDFWSWIHNPVDTMIPSTKNSALQRIRDSIGYFDRLHAYGDEALSEAIQKPKKITWDKDTAEDIYFCQHNMKMSNTIFLGWGGESVERLGAYIHDIIGGKKVLLIDLSKVNDAEDLWTHVFLPSKRDNDTVWIMTGLEQVEDEDLQCYLYQMMKRDDDGYGPCFKEWIMFCKMNIILVTKSKRTEDILPDFVRGKSLYVYIEQVK